ncbi:unnamed protein product [Amoebophrya sp. A25]|nr:unnamed protein product [Amoebophrya sp. A25]|eukprot:GSA25T00018669001.1
MSVCGPASTTADTSSAPAEPIAQYTAVDANPVVKTTSEEEVGDVTMKTDVAAEAASSVEADQTGASTAQKIEVSPGVWVNPQAVPTAGDPESKNATKKRLREERANERKQETKRRKKEQEKKKKEEKRAAALQAPEEGTANTSKAAGEEQEGARNNPTRQEGREIRKQALLLKAENNAKILIDCDWDKLMTEKEVKSLASQLMYSYNKNKTSEAPSHFLLSKCDGRVKESLDRIGGSDKWPAFWRTEECLLQKFLQPAAEKSETSSCAASSSALEKNEKDVVVEVCKTSEESSVSSSNAMPSDNTPASTPTEKEAPPAGRSTEGDDDNITSSKLFSLDSFVLEKEKTVILTADTDDVLTEIDPSVTYVIGGVVDRNRLKNATRQKADFYGVRAQRLPISEFVDSDLGSFSKVLTVNHVVEILLHYQATKDWTAALEQVLPKRRKEMGTKEKERARELLEAKLQAVRDGRDGKKDDDGGEKKDAAEKKEATAEMKAEGEEESVDVTDKRGDKNTTSEKTA